MRAPTWKSDGKCFGKPHLFFARRNEHRRQREIREASAKQLCASCPVMERCRIAGRVGLEFGIWGGETEEERAAAGFVSFVDTHALREAAQKARARGL